MRALLIGLLLVVMIAVVVFSDADASPLTSGCQPSPMLLRGANFGTLCPGGQEDLYYFRARHDDSVTIVMESRSTVTPKLELWDCCVGSGNVLASSSDSSKTCLSGFQLPYTGTYAIRAGSRDESTGTYKIWLRFNSSSCEF